MRYAIPHLARTNYANLIDTPYVPPASQQELHPNLPDGQPFICLQTQVCDYEDGKYTARKPA
jgi:hypothetical protein